jgi:phosphoglycerate dehydrogenase-like enzyme
VTSRRRLVVDLASPRAAWRIPQERIAEIGAALGPAWDVAVVQAPASSDGDGGSGSAESIAAARGAEIYLGWGLPSGVAEASRETLRWAHSGSAGVGSSLDYLRGRNLVLTNSAGVHAEPMADWVIAAIAYFARGLDVMRDAQAAGRWDKDAFTDLALPVREFRDLRVGIMGLGGIGKAVARRALALGMAVAGVRRRPEHGGPPPAGVRWVGPLADLPRLAADSDCLVIAAPHTPETAGSVSRSVLERLPRDAIVVNVSRGALLDETALRELLAARRLRGAALDVFAAEPLPAGHPFWTEPRVLVSPHVSAVSTRFWERETALIVDNIRRYLAGAPLSNVVDLEAGY